MGMINKIKEDLSKHDKRESALTLLLEQFDDFMNLKNLKNLYLVYRLNWAITLDD